MGVAEGTTTPWSGVTGGSGTLWAGVAGGSATLWLGVAGGSATPWPGSAGGSVTPWLEVARDPGPSLNPEDLGTLGQSREVARNSAKLALLGLVSAMILRAFEFRDSGVLESSPVGGDQAPPKRSLLEVGSESMKLGFLGLVSAMVLAHLQNPKF